MTREQEDYLFLLRRAVRWSLLTEADRMRLERVNMESLFAMAYTQSQGELFYMYLTEQGVPLPEAVEKTARGMLDHSIHRELLMNVERETIYRFMDAKGIWHCSLKGILIQPLYPAVGTRYASDNDILMDETKGKELRTYLLERGYQLLEIGYMHDSYLKNPSYHFEFHKKLIDSELCKEAEVYLNGIFPRLKKANETGFLYEMTPEDFYIHMVVHAFEHYRQKGTGLRYIVDLFYYLRMYRKDMDMERVQSLLASFGTDRFEVVLKELAEVLFGDGEEKTEYSDAQEEMLAYMFKAGSHGNDTLYVDNSIANFNEESKTDFGRKIKYIKHRMFPDMEWYRKNYPFLYRWKIWIPFFVVYRMIRGLIWSPLAKKELKVLMKKDLKKVENERNFERHSESSGQ